MIELFLITTEMLLANLFLWDRCAKRRYSVVTTVAVYILFRVLLGGWAWLIDSVYHDGPLTILAGFLYIVPIFFLYDTRLLKLINIFFFLWIYSFSLYSISYFASLFFPIDYTMRAFLLVQTGLYAVSFHYYYRYMIPKYAYMIDYISESDELWFTLLSMLWFLVLFLIYTVFTTAWYLLSRIIVIMLFLIVVTISSRLIYNLVLAKIQMYQLEVRLSHQIGQYNEAKNHLLEIRKLSHDINKYNAVIQYAIKEKNYEYLEEFSSAAFENLYPQNELPDTGNETLDALLYDLSHQCEQKDIRLEMTLDSSVYRGIRVEALDLTTVLGNLFENAIEACELIEEPEQRWITVNVKRSSTMVHMTIANASNHRKKNNRHGFKQLLPEQLGLANVERTVKKLGGVMNREKQENSYVVTLAIANRNQE
ncbi:hypothetical protein NRIC_29670 [Enterococcus florum]|uniref:Sensor histidine kinase NatK-like C-terminal domain-containing protein n=1 Tax=Enterococcus florum TaxID=2480627 RepID=A0A4P5PBH5_9ENTE|nr:GHKL domain-containing protein [Enterococcus florum]GCF95076.1 hypothetical protein NRIC_29670 [Enterococcus florum]